MLLMSVNITFLVEVIMVMIVSIVTPIAKAIEVTDALI